MLKLFGILAILAFSLNYSNCFLFSHTPFFMDQNDIKHLVDSSLYNLRNDFSETKPLMVESSEIKDKDGNKFLRKDLIVKSIGIKNLNKIIKRLYKSMDDEYESINNDEYFEPVLVDKRIQKPNYNNLKNLQMSSESVIESMLLPFDQRSLEEKKLLENVNPDSVNTILTMIDSNHNNEDIAESLVKDIDENSNEHWTKVHKLPNFLDEYERPRVQENKEVEQQQPQQQVEGEEYEEDNLGDLINMPREETTDMDENLAKLEDTINQKEESFLKQILTSSSLYNSNEDSESSSNDDQENLREQAVKKNYDQQEQMTEPMSQQYLPSSSSRSDLPLDANTKNTNYEFIDSSYVFIQVDNKEGISKESLTLLFEFVSETNNIPLSSFENIEFNKDYTLVTFKVNTLYYNTTDIVNNLVNDKLKVLHETGLNIVSCGIGKDNHKLDLLSKHLFGINTKSERFFILTIVICITIVCILVLLMGIFLIKRKAHLRSKLANDVGIVPGKKFVLDDEESLIKIDKTGSSLSWFNFLRRSTNEDLKKNNQESSKDYKELCRSRMQNKPNAQNLNTTICSTLNDSTACLVTPNNSTPARPSSVGSDSLQKADSNRSSTSS